MSPLAVLRAAPALVALAALPMPLAVCAQAAATAKPPALSAAEEEDLRFEDALRNFGFVAGAAYQCLPESDRTAHDREVLKAYSGIVRLFGSDRAFFFAAAYGAGGSMAIDKTRCTAHIDAFRAAMKAGNRGQ